VNFQDLDLAIEFTKGSKRPYRDDAGNQQFKTMKADYGEVLGTKGLDGDAVDVYVGPDKDSDRVFVVTQMKRGDWAKVDEEKCILGTSSAAQAKKLYLSHYNDTRFCGAIKEMSMDRFKSRLETRGAVGEKIAASAHRIAEINYLRMAAGDPVLLASHGVKVAIDALKPVEARQGRTLLGSSPDVTSVPAMTDFGDAQPGAKVGSIDWKARVAALNARRDPDGLNVQRKVGSMDIKTRLDRLRDRRIPPEDQTKEVELTKDEQRGIGVPESKIVGDPTDSKLRKSAAALLINDFIKRAAGTARAARIADRVDDVGIGMLAAPYAANAVGAGANRLGGALAHRGGRVGAIGRGLQTVGAGAMHAHGKLHDNTALELGGLALVAPGITHRVAGAIDKRLPGGAKTAGAADAAKAVVRRGAQAGAGAVLLGGAGVGAGVIGAKKLLTSHRHEGLSAVQYEPPRLF
jgi:hypothetical protein